MKYRPILYSTDMVKELIQNRKSQTRRTKGLEFINNSLSDWEYLGINGIRHLMRNEYGAINAIVCPFGQPGDIHWVRESFTIIGSSPIRGEDGEIIEDRFDYCYRGQKQPHIEKLYKFKPSIHMPKSACRLFLQVKLIKVERLQDISEQDAICEGAKKGIFRYGPNHLKNQFQLELNNHGFHFDGFKFIWLQKYGFESWQLNPWVWVITFERVEKPKNWPLI